MFVYLHLPGYIPFFYLQFFLFFHNNKPKNTNSVVKYKHKIFTIVYCNIIINLI